MFSHFHFLRSRVSDIIFPIASAAIIIFKQASPPIITDAINIPFSLISSVLKYFFNIVDIRTSNIIALVKERGKQSPPLQQG
jgi:hypothetical protein